MVAVLDGSGNNIQAMSYDAWGRRSNPNQWQQLLPLLQNDWSLTQYVTRGYTGHEPIDSMGLVHMNGRVYDPHLGRFTQADPFIQFPGSSQSYNRYSYVLNNPLAYTDPSGYFSFRELVGTAVGIVLHIWAPWGTGLWQSISYGAIAGGAGAAANGGSILRGALSGGVSAAAFYTVGTTFENCSSCKGSFAGSGLNPGAFVSKVGAHGVVGGVMSELQGGKFGHGFASAGITQAFSSKIDGLDQGARVSVYRITAAAIVGGTTSTITGGKFANGALTGAFSRAFNDEVHHQKQAVAKKGGNENTKPGIFQGIVDGVKSIAKDLGFFAGYTARSVGIYGSEQANMARQEGLAVDRMVSDCVSSSSCRENVQIAVKGYIEVNDSAYFRARVATRTVVGVLTGAGLGSTHGAIDNAVLDGATSAESLIPGVIYGYD